MEIYKIENYWRNKLIKFCNFFYKNVSQLIEMCQIEEITVKWRKESVKLSFGTKFIC